MSPTEDRSVAGGTFADDQCAVVFIDRRKLKTFFILVEPVVAGDDESREAACWYSGSISHDC